MRSPFRKLGLIFSAAAVLFATLCLPFHYHESRAAAADSSHCAVCHFSKETRSAGLAAAARPIPLLQETAALLFYDWNPSPTLKPQASSPRAPPQA